MLNQYQRINGHGHLLPYPHQIPRFMKESRFFWVDEKCQFMHQGDWKRPITDDSFFLNEKIAWMEKHNIQHEVVLTLSQLYCNGVNEQQTHDIIRFQNDFNASVQNEHPQLFTTGFVVQPAYIDQALLEIERCVNDLNLKLLCLSTHYQNSQGQWLSVADESIKPIWELANTLGIAVEIHPYDAGKMVALSDQYWRYHLVWMMAQTADTHLMYMLNGLAQTYQNVRTCFAHGAMLSQMNYGRVMQGVEGRPDLFQGATHPEKTIAQPNVFFDTLVHDSLSLDLMVKRCGASQLVWGLDDPYPLGEMETVKDCYPGILMDNAEREGVISTDDKSAIMSSNVVRWLFGEQ